MLDEKNVKGFADLQRALDQLAPKIERNVMSGALRAGAKVIQLDAKQRCPVGPPSSRGAKKYKLYAGALRDSIRVGTKTARGVVTATIKAGGKAKNGAVVFYANMIERTGSIAHMIRARKGSSITIGGNNYTSVDHPGMNAQPFMRPALDGKAGAAVQATGEYIKRRLQTKEGIDTSGITIEVEE